MKNALSTMITMACALLVSGCFAEKEVPKQPTVETVTITSPSLQNNVLPIKAQRELIISLPPSYHSDSSKTYPVVYLLHGLGANAYGWFSNIGGEPNVTNALKTLYAQQQINEMIIVVPDSFTEHAKGGWYSNSTSGGSWEDYILKDVIPYVEANYRTNQQRGIAGSSMGGYGALNFAINYPELFSGVYAMSPALVGEHWLSNMKTDAQLADINAGLSKPKDQWSWWETINYSVALAFAPSNTAPLYAEVPFTQQTVERISAHSIMTALNQLSANQLENIKEKVTAIKLDVGNKDIAIRGDLRVLSSELEQKGINAFYSEYPGGHADRLNLLIEQEVFQFFSQHFANALPAEPPASLAAMSNSLAPKPQIVELDAFTLTGIAASGYEGNQQLTELWPRVNNSGIDISTCNNKAGIGLSTQDLSVYNFTKSNQLEYMVGCELLQGASFPASLASETVSREIPKNTYAVFEFKGVMDNRYTEFWQAIMLDWFPSSGYDHTGGYFFEYYGPESAANSDESVMKLYFPIKKK
ncbi:effector binding domain-containing protein [Motilimonas cestriensis]|uniref:Effector binding domain-containing protein n=1 Tax=Motilimonas cestriensis TaxID=2742685 RepID=A0ABS8W7C2_9GAMM|nr:alpha/beta hydrolase-fold protein [Motilimonas cestriensis]MCE2594385.1 effector binding domain-containing protein [Motilimonas cestriensis]